MNILNKKIKFQVLKKKPAKDKKRFLVQSAKIHILSPLLPYKHIYARFPSRHQVACFNITFILTKLAFGRSKKIERRAENMRVADNQGFQTLKR